MNILMMTNTYLPHVGGVANSVAAFKAGLERLGHAVLVVAPQYSEEGEGKSAGVEDGDVVRCPALQNFNGSDFSVLVPVPKFLHYRLRGFAPHVVHAHHPYLIGSTAVRIASTLSLPLVYTQHTRFEEYTHYVPLGQEKLKQFVIRLSTGYANMADAVIAPSESIAGVLRERGVVRPIRVIPTGIDLSMFHGARSGSKIREEQGIPRHARVLGHVGRLAPEKNLEFLGQAVAAFMRKDTNAHFLVVGYGPSRDELRQILRRSGVEDRVHFAGKRTGPELADAYDAMDVFVFSSLSETQGLVVAEAMACGVPVVAVDAPGVREVVRDGANGYLLEQPDRKAFVRALERLWSLSPSERRTLGDAARHTATLFSTERQVARLIQVYQEVAPGPESNRRRDDSIWKKAVERFGVEWELLTNLTGAAGDAVQPGTKGNDA